MTRPTLALFVSLVTTAGLLAILACGDPAGPGAATSYDVTVIPRGPSGTPARFTGTNAGYVVARTPIDERQTMWRSIVTIRLMKSGDAPVAVFVIHFPDTTVRFGRIDIVRILPSPLPASGVATGDVVPPTGVGVLPIESGQLELTEGPGGVVEASFTAQLLSIPMAGVIVEVVADAAGQFVARRLTR